MKRLIAKLLGMAVLAIGAYSLGVYFFGPGAEVRAVFDRLRRHALRSDRATVAALSYGDRLGIMALRHAVSIGRLSLDTLRIDAPATFYAAGRQALPSRDPGMVKWLLTTVLPTGLGEAWGTVDPSGMTIDPTMSFIMSLFGPIRYRFERIDGRWRVDPLPLLRSSANENEYWARQMEPTGNAFIFHVLRVSDPVQIEQLWRPLEQS
jgi:hypothetical protein